MRCFGMVGVHESREKPGFGLDLGDGSRGSQLWLVGTWIFIDVDTIYINRSYKFIQCMYMYIHIHVFL